MTSMPTRLIATVMKQVTSCWDMSPDFADSAGFSDQVRRIIVSLSAYWGQFSNRPQQKNDNRNTPRLDWDCLLGDLFLVDAPAFFAPGNDIEGIARRNEADREIVESRARHDSRRPSQGRGDQGIGEGCLGQGVGADELTRISACASSRSEIQG